MDEKNPLKNEKEILYLRKSERFQTGLRKIAKVTGFPALLSF
jgi:hypothetical protein